ncbi:MAG: TonB-dependent receptor [Cytophagaceae bacterium]|nr:TonB-dependent receptor [Cytophagaceae bacterium]MBL0302948.1 TonB-dependent receptor [Cytophagaceae bacterium]MBL0325779.1 TonB-dependent receptor [Cytophagaceae bacterium]
MAKLKFIILCVLMSSSMLFAQEKFTISGTMRDKATGEELIGATVVVKEIPNTGKAANEYGFYSITLPKGNYTLRATYIGYNEIEKTITLDKNLKIDWDLESGKMLQEVVVKATKEDENITKTSMGTEKLDIKEIAKLPVLFGEKDVLKTIQLLPGIKSAGEGNSGFYVRGGGSDQNLILLDEAPVYNASHLLGFFSTFNSDAIKDATIIKGNSPSQYGGRLSSVLDVRMREGNDKEFQTSGGIGLISSRLAIEGPIQKEKSSFMISGRRTYADLFLKATPDFSDTQLYFYDLNAKANYRINENNRIFVSGYFGRDKLGFGEGVGVDWGNKTGTLRWNSILNSKWFSNTSLIYSDYSYEFNISGGDNSFKNQSIIKDWNLKQEFQFFPNNKNSWRFGFNTISHNITPGSLINTDDESQSKVKDTRKAWENAIYANNTYSVSPKFSVDYGLRLSSWSILGGTTYNIYDKGVKQDSVVLANNTIGKTYFNLEPRLAFNFIINNKNSIKAGYARNTQNLHLLSNSTSSTPTDQWIGSSYNIKPEIADQVSLGYFRNFANNKYEFSAETYYKSLQNQVDYKNGADINTSPDVESELLYGKGRAYGLELYLKKKSGRFTGWASYTLSRTERKIDGINDGNWYAANQDRTHDFSIVGMYQLTPKWSLASNFIFYTGNAVTFPSGKYEVAGNTTFYYTERNGYRMPNYHRLDLSATYEKPRKGKYQSSWNFSLYNAYGRENAYTITFEDNETDPTRTSAIQTSLFRWVPSVTYNFKF